MRKIRKNGKIELKKRKISKNVKKQRPRRNFPSIYGIFRLYNSDVYEVAFSKRIRQGEKTGRFKGEFGQKIASKMQKTPLYSINIT